MAAPTTLILSANPIGWSNESLFVDDLKHFIACERPCQAGAVDIRQS